VRAAPGEVRIGGGIWKRTPLPVADVPGLRPTPDRVRQTLFNWLGQTLTGWRCVDAYAGTGALGFEAASRGASEVVLVERDPKAVCLLLAARERLGAEKFVRVERGDAIAWLARAPAGTFDAVFIDPPFGSNEAVDALVAAARVVRAGGFVYVESAECVEAPAAAELEKVRESRAGSVRFALFSTPDRGRSRGYTAPRLPENTA